MRGQSTQQAVRLTILAQETEGTADSLVLPPRVPELPDSCRPALAER